MEKEELIEKGRENDELTKFSYGIYQQIDEFRKEHPKTNVLVLMSDGVGGADFLIGESSKIARDFMEAANRHKGFLEVMANVLKALEEAE